MLEALVAILEPLGPSGAHRGLPRVPFLPILVRFGRHSGIIFGLFQNQLKLTEIIQTHSKWITLHGNPNRSKLTQINHHQPNRPKSTTRGTNETKETSVKSVKTNSSKGYLKQLKLTEPTRKCSLRTIQHPVKRAQKKHSSWIRTSSNHRNSVEITIEFSI